MNHNQKKQVIAGPCALESKEQIRSCVSELKNLQISSIRASLWKPRTEPGWEGLGWMSLPLFLEETIPYGMIPATEILTSEHAEMISQALKLYGENAEMVVWLGSRNQNHLEQQKIASILAKSSKGITLMFKNQMWDDERHWLGIYQHLTNAGFPKERLISCHRGFSPGKLENPFQFRNLPDFSMAMRIKEKLKIPMFLDPSHIGGSQENVFRIMKMAKNFDFDGYLIEVHEDPKQAKTDAKQQLTLSQFGKLLEILNLKPFIEKLG